MEFETHVINDLRAAVIRSDQVLINDEQEAIELVGNAWYQGFEGLILHRHQFGTGFFDLSRGLAGAVFQKFTNYRLRLVIVGDFSGCSKSLGDFIVESNKGRQVNFAASLEQALKMLAL